MNTKSWHSYQITSFVILVIAVFFYLTGDYQTVGILIMAAGAAQIGSGVVLQSDSFKEQSKSTASSGILLILVGTIYQLVGVYHNDITVWLHSCLDLSPSDIGCWSGRLLVVSTVVVLLGLIVFEWLKTASQSNQKVEQQGSNESNQTPESNKIPETPKTQNSSDHWLGLWVFFVVLVALVVLVLGAYLYQFHVTLNYSLSNETGDWGTFGDYVGGLLNPTFTLIMLFFVWHTFKRERNEVQHQKFEDRFFKLLELYQQTRQQLMTPVIVPFYEKIKDRLDRSFPGETETDRQKRTNRYFQGAFVVHPDELYHQPSKEKWEKDVPRGLERYSHVLFFTLRFLENSHVDENTRNEFANVLHAYLSMEERLVLQYYYCGYIADTAEKQEQTAEKQQQKEFCKLVKRFLLYR